MNGRKVPRSPCRPKARRQSRAPQAQLEGLIEQLYEALDAADYFHPPDRTAATKNTIRTILTKAGWSVREVQALRGIVRALRDPKYRSAKATDMKGNSRASSPGPRNKNG